jgi:hypothetical protein
MPKRTYLIDRHTKAKYRIDGLLPSDSTSEEACCGQNFSDHIVLGSAQLPPKVDLRSKMTPVEDQSGTNSW